MLFFACCLSAGEPWTATLLHSEVASMWLQRFLVLPVLVAAMLCTRPAGATDGVIEINQAKALAGDVSPGDAPGFPVSLNQGGSYRLTSNLDLNFLGAETAVDTNAIEISGSPSVTIDLNGFSISGPVTCPFAAPCTLTGDGVGIKSVSGERSVTIRNGSVAGFGSQGVYLASGFNRVEGVTVMHNALDGMYVGYGLVVDSVAAHNGGTGISVYETVVEHSFGRNNAAYQIRAEFGSIVNSTAESSGGAALYVGHGLVTSTIVKVNGLLPALECGSRCALGGNHFAACQGAACFTGLGTIVQIPPDSNMCGDAACP